MQTLYEYLSNTNIPRDYLCYKTNENINIDGDLNKQIWLETPWTEEFIDIEGQKIPNQTTKVKMRYNNEFFYVGAYMEETEIVANLTENNSVIYHDNDFEVFIDPNWSSHQYTEFEINALNTIWALLIINPYRDGYNIINPYPITGLKSAVKLYGTLNDPDNLDHGWSVEIAFPWNILRQFADSPTPPLHGDQWRINFSRVEWKFDVINGQYVKRKDTAEENWVWSPQYEINMHKPETFGFVQFSEKLIEEDKFVLDKERFDIQNILVWIYKLQQSYKIKNNRYASCYEELGETVQSEFINSNLPRIKLNKIRLNKVYGYEASILSISEDFKNIANKIHYIRGDSKRWTTIYELN